MRLHRATFRTILRNCRRPAFALLSVIGCVCAISTKTACGQEPTLAVSSPVDDLVALLTADDFRTRRSAEQELQQIAIEHLPDIARAALIAPEEASVRLLAVLETTFQKHEDQAGDLAEQLLMRLAMYPGTVGIRANSILLANARIREGRARLAIAQMGGQVIYQSPYKETARVLAPLAAGPGIGYGEEGVIHSIWLYEEWSGGQAGLWHLARFAHVPYLTIYTSPENQLQRQDILIAVGGRFGVSVEVRGGCLGISGIRDIVGEFAIGQVLERTAADAAGMQPGDIIQELNEHPIQSFEDLVGTLRANRAGDRITVKFIRNGFDTRPDGIFGQVPTRKGGSDRRETFVKEVRLGTWRESQLGAGYVSPPTIFRGPFGPPLGDAAPPPPPLPEQAFDEHTGGMKLL